MTELTASRKVAIAAAALLVVAVSAWFAFLRPSDDDRIRQVLDRLAKAVQVKPADTLLSRGGRVRSELKELVTDDVHVDVPDLAVRVSTRASLVDAAVTGGVAFTTADVAFTGLTIKVDETRTSARVDGVAVVRGNRGGDEREDRRRVHLLLRRDDTWKITTIDVAGAE